MTQRAFDHLLTAGIADMLSTASSPAHSRLREIEAVAFENCGISKGKSQVRALQGDRGTDPHHFPHVRQLKWPSRG